MSIESAAGAPAGQHTTGVAYTDGTATQGGIIAPGVDYTSTRSSYVFDGAARGTTSIPISVRGDALVEEDETFTVTLTPPPGWAAHPHGTVTIADDDRAGTKIAFGNDAAATAAYTAAVVENVSGGSLNVPVSSPHWRAVLSIASRVSNAFGTMRCTKDHYAIRLRW